MIDLRAIAARYGGQLAGRECLIPTPGHSRHDRGTALRLARQAPDGLLVVCYNGGRADALAVKDMLRRDGLLPKHDCVDLELSQGGRAAIERAAAAREQEKQERNANAAQVALQRLAQAVPADQDHPYLFRKRIAPERLWQSGKWLLVPMQDDAGAVWNVQRIPPEADALKLYLKGGRTKGLFWWAGKATDRIVIGEGMSTCAAVRRATGLPVVAAMTAGNLPHVAVTIRQRRPDLQIIIAADDDEAGMKAARIASQRTGASTATPGGITHG